MIDDFSRRIWNAGVKSGRTQGLEWGLMIGFAVGLLGGILVTRIF